MRIAPIIKDVVIITAGIVMTVANEVIEGTEGTEGTGATEVIAKTGLAAARRSAAKAGA